MTEQHLEQQQVRTVWWEEGDADGNGPYVRLLDQSLLPLQVVYLQLAHEQQVADAISTLKVRGAPVIGVTAAFGMALALRRFLRECYEQARAIAPADAQAHLRSVGHLLAQTRPTAVNLFWAIERMLHCVE